MVAWRHMACGARWRRTWWLAAGAACVQVLGGCADTPARHEVLSFFFAGVPEPGAEPPPPPPRNLTPKERLKLLREAAQRASFREPTNFEHGPYAATMCERCHIATNPEGGRGSKRIGPRFVAPLAGLCITCHSDMSGQTAQTQGLAAHKPVADGQCLHCHHPHMTGRRYMLKDDSVGLCMTCHAAGKEGGVPASAVHREDPRKDCMECHNPHMGKTPQLLRADFDEWYRYDIGGMPAR